MFDFVGCVRTEAEDGIATVHSTGGYKCIMNGATPFFDVNEDRELGKLVPFTPEQQQKIDECFRLADELGMKYYNDYVGFSVKAKDVYVDKDDNVYLGKIYVGSDMGADKGRIAENDRIIYMDDFAPETTSDMKHVDSTNIDTYRFEYGFFLYYFLISENDNKHFELLDPMVNAINDSDGDSIGYDTLGFVVDSSSTPTEEVGYLYNNPPRVNAPANITYKYIRFSDSSDISGYAEFRTFVIQGERYTMMLRTVNDSLLTNIMNIRPESKTLILYASGVIMLIAAVIALTASYARYRVQLAAYNIVESQRKMTRAMAHDLKTPLAELCGYAEAVAENAVPDKQEHYLHEVRESAMNMTRIVNKVIDFAKTGDEYKMKIAPVDVRMLVESIRSKFDARINSRDLKLTVDGEMTLDTDEFLLKQVMLNLLENAVNYSSQGSSISVKIGDNKIEINNTVAQAVSKSVDELRKPFVRGEESRKGKGSGLGLSIVENNLKLLGYSLELETQDKTFTSRILTCPRNKHRRRTCRRD